MTDVLQSCLVYHYQVWEGFKSDVPGETSGGAPPSSIPISKDIVVSPFDTTESDISWEAVHEWVRQLHGVDSFLDNLNHFGSTQIAPPIVQNTLDFLSHADLFPAKVALNFRLSQANIPTCNSCELL